MKDFKIPKLAKGTELPESVLMSMFKDAKDKQKIREDRIHNWKIAIFSVVGGAISGLITSFIFWSLTK